MLNEMIGQPWDPKGARELEVIRHRPQTGPEPTIGRATEGRAPKTAGCYACRTGHGNHNKECKEKQAEWLENKRKEEQSARTETAESSSSSAVAGASEGGAAAAAAPSTKKRKEAPEEHVEMKEQEERGEKRKAEPTTADAALKAMRVEEMIAFINEIEADLKSLHESDFVPDSSLDPTKDQDLSLIHI